MVFAQLALLQGTIINLTVNSFQKTYCHNGRTNTAQSLAGREFYRCNLMDNMRLSSPPRLGGEVEVGGWSGLAGKLRALPTAPLFLVGLGLQPNWLKKTYAENAISDFQCV